MIWPMTGKIQPYAWGSITMLPELLGYEPTGEPQAEWWLGAHGSAPSEVAGRPLSEAIAEDPAEVVGEASVAAFGPQLPFLLKLLAAGRPLSLQAHPSREQAEAGAAREDEAGLPKDAPERTYRDDWPKPEVLCALVDTEALCGFRDPGDTYALFETLGSPRALELVAPLAEADVPAEKRTAAVFERLLQLDDDERGVIDEVVAVAQLGVGDGLFGSFLATARELGEHFPRDPGVLAGLLLNRVALAPYEAVYLPAGNLHAYLHGGGVEIMANSDNVIRGGLTSKHINVDELMSVLDFTPGFAGLIQTVEEAPGVWRYPTPAPEFMLWRLEPRGAQVPVPAAGSGRVLVATSGSVTIASASEELVLAQGKAAFVTASEDVRATGDGVVFVAGPGVGLAGAGDL